ncbi:nickel-dependent hydrogenase large subunit, partial [bacterium]|nr:nickel-dependent hydrogenase large subunit [bacterium]
DMAYSIAPPANGRILRDLILGANFLQSHITHFYHFSVPDYVDFSDVKEYKGNDARLNHFKQWLASPPPSDYPGTPFLTRYNGGLIAKSDINIHLTDSYITAYDMRRLTHQAAAVFCGKMPHASALIPGGISEAVTPLNQANYISKLRSIRAFVANRYIPDLLSMAAEFPGYFQMGKSYGNYLAYGVFHSIDEASPSLFPGGVYLNGELNPFDREAIHETLRYAFFQANSSAQNSPHSAVPAPEKEGAYSWIKAPRYKQAAMEVGPLARVMIAYHAGTNAALKQRVDRYLKKLGKTIDDLNSVWGRHLARALECEMIADHCLVLADQLTPDQKNFTDFSIPEEGAGHGLSEAPRGALGHWLEIEDKKIASYQCVVPTTWNCSPRDEKDLPGVMEKALENTPIAQEESPLEAARVVRAFDPCLACAVH